MTGKSQTPAKTSTGTQSASTRSLRKRGTRKAVERGTPAASSDGRKRVDGSDSGRTWVRSPQTYQAILDATIDCFVEIGYERTTTTEIARKADFTRGAVQYYFPTTSHALEASIRYLMSEWLEEYTDAARNAPEGTDSIDYAVDTLWRFVNNRLFVAWQELVAASRTNAELRRIIKPAAVKFEKLRREMGRETFRDFHDANSAKFQRNRDTLRFVLEGMTSTIMTFDRKERVQAQLDWLKEWFHASWQEELKAKKVQARTRKRPG
jgi:AcrR family transcriptional regulator